MTSSDTREKLAPRTVLLHWVIALAIIGQLAYGLYIANLGEALDADPKNAALKADFGWNIGIHIW